MAKNIATRIAERTDRSELYLQDKGLIRRAVGKAGLGLANTLDRLTAWGTSNFSVFLSGSIGGAARGALYGSLIAFAGAAFFPAALTAWPIWVIVGGATIFAVHDGQKSIEKHATGTANLLSDRIARMSGAVSETHARMNSGPAETLRSHGRDPNLMKKAQATLAYAMEHEPEFAARERARRARNDQIRAQQGPGPQAGR